MNTYEQLREILDSHPSTAPKGEAIDEILRILFTPEEAAIAVKMSFKPKSRPALLKLAGVSEDEATKTSGVHGQQRHYFFHRIRMAKNSMVWFRSFPVFLNFPL